MKHVALALLAHPDDAEMLCAGTLIQVSRHKGWSVVIATMTAGDCGSIEHSSSEIARIRQVEATNSAGLIGGTYQCLGERDLSVFYDETTLAKVTRLLRAVRPNILFTHSPHDYHLDHEMTSQLVRAAAFAAPVPLFHNETGEPKPLDHVPHLYYCDPVDGKDVFGKAIAPAFVVTVDNEIELKTEMLACHASQRNWLLAHHGIDHYLDTMRKWSASRGQLVSAAFGEGFRQHLGHGYPQDNPLGKLCQLVLLSS